MKWISVKDRFPDIGYEVLVLFNYKRQVTSGIRMARNNFKTGQYGCVSVTHWMPLPKPPKELGK